MKGAARKKCLYACLLVAAAAVSFAHGAAAQAATCPSLTADDIGSPQMQQTLWGNVIKACTSSSPASPAPPCGPCHCALVNAVAPRLAKSGAILTTEMYTATAATTLSATLSSCMREFSLQVLENTELKIGQLTSMDVCVPDVRTVTQCLTQPPASTNSTAASANSTAQAALPAWADLVRDASCALAAAANSAGVNASADNVMCEMTTGASAWLQEFVAAPAPAADSSSSSSRGLAISSKTTRGPIRWMAGCWCDDNFDPVCDAATRVQYPNPCSADCQYVKTAVPCSSLPPLVRQGLLPGGDGSVLVYDNALFKAAAAQPVAFDGGVPAPTEADEDAQMFYYYYDDDADDTEDALDLSQGFVKAMRAANIGASDKAAAASLEAASATAAANSSAPATVQAQDGPAANSTAAAMPLAGMLAEAMNVTRVGGLMANLPNLTNPITVIARVRDAVANSTAGAAAAAAAAAAARQPERRSTVRLNTAQDPSLPSWLNTGSPDATPAVYSRNADRTSRILAALMASARESNTREETAGFVAQLSGGLDQVLKNAEGAAAARRASASANAATPAGSAGAISGGLFRSADAGNAIAAAPAPVLGGMLTTLEEAARNSTGMLASALNGTMVNATAALDAARPVLALGGARDTPILDQLDVSVRGFGSVVQQIGETLREAGAAARENAAAPTVRAASANSTAAANSTKVAAAPAMNATMVNSTMANATMANATMANATMANATAADGAMDTPMLSANSTANATASNATAANSTASGSAGDDDGDDDAAQAAGSQQQGRRRQRSRRAMLLL